MKETVAIDKPVKMTRCASKDGCVARKTKCKTHDLWHGLERNIYNYLGSILFHKLFMSKKLHVHKYDCRT